MSNNSTSGGYIQPATTQPLPGGLDVTHFIQTVLVGVSGFVGNLVRRQWQTNPPPMPDISTDWLSFAILNSDTDKNAVYQMDDTGNENFQRHQLLEVRCYMYGPNALVNVDNVKDALELPQNLEALQSAKMGYVEATQALHAPELINERFFERYDFTLFFRRQILRTYPVLSLVSASGQIVSVPQLVEYIQDWQTN